METASELARREWDYPDINKRDWGPGEWLNEPDKVQCVKMGFPCLILRSHHGAWCGYVGVPQGHPFYGLNYNGIPDLVAEIIHADFREKIKEWSEAGRPVNEKGLPDIPMDMEEVQPSIVGQKLIEIQVHSGLTYSGTCANVSEASWKDLVAQFPRARDMASQYPIGDAAMWLHKWEPAEYSYENFLNICRASCMVLDPPDDSIWFFGFDCAHGGDQLPAVRYAMQKLKEMGMQQLPDPFHKEDKYRDLIYVENECHNLAVQLFNAKE